MSKVDWITKQPARIHCQGVRETVKQDRQEIVNYLLRLADKIDHRGLPILEEDWDVLIVLDGCRVDLLEQVSEEYYFLSSPIRSVRSLGSASMTWMNQNFSEDYIQKTRKTAYITGNPFSQRYLDKQTFALIDEVWRYGWDEEIGTVPARHITDRAIMTARNQNFDRLIIHYMQPHFPSIPSPLNSGMNLETFGESWSSVWERLRSGNIEKEAVWDSYLENLRYVLDDIELLLKNMNAERVVISADHGNALGEWGQYGHPANMPIGVLRDVPWVETTSQDEENYLPSYERKADSIDDTEVKSRLEDLGYM
ncbi:hypothetical protein [Halorubrum distributum]|uniref:Sulfatase N-terminal domain-containing protein n=1 Tax=Halorubrum distributum JCM 10247 TaxID=1227486 RepID=M0DR76_9EURY|nr:hypothetical protein [Halorubrum terrestre]ELZ37187.1 hypothetical protein C473_01664 [Halorubrum terrestre JCM 10247]